MEDDRRVTALFDRRASCHRYRMLGSFDEAEDAVQDAFLRAWRSRDTARGEFRAWLPQPAPDLLRRPFRPPHRIATNASLDAIGRRPEAKRRAVPGGGSPIAEVTWLQPYPDVLLDQVPDPSDAPEAVVVARETIELARPTRPGPPPSALPSPSILAALQHLPRQRAVLALRDVVGWRAADTADLLGLSVAAANSALQRVRATLREQLPERDDRRGDRSSELAVARSFLAASEGADPDAFAGLLAEHARHTMPPLPVQVHGRDAVLDSWRDVLVGPDAWGDRRVLLTSVNRMPALARYLRPRRRIAFPDGSVAEPGRWFERGPLDVLRIEGGQVVEVTTFGTECYDALGLPERLP